MINESKYEILFKVNSPTDIKNFSLHELKTLAPKYVSIWSM